MTFSLCSANFIAALLWLAYGYLQRDKFIIVSIYLKFQLHPSAWPHLSLRDTASPIMHYLHFSTLTQRWLIDRFIDWLINPFEFLFGIKGHVALDTNPGPRYNTLLLWLISWDLESAFPRRQFPTILDLSDTQAALPYSYPNSCVPSRDAVCTIFMMVFANPRTIAWEG